MNNPPTLKLGIIGCGAISNLYFKGCVTFPNLAVVHCADLDEERARLKAVEFAIPRYGSVSQLLSDPEVDIVINLTIPKAHSTINLSALDAGKHVYCEKPFAISRAEATNVLSVAAKKGLRIGSAPDTFLGEAQQTCRKLIDDGAIGCPVSAVAFMAGHGTEAWHPNPSFYYEVGGGPMFDMGPYYLTALVNLLGPMRRISGSTKISFSERLITSEPLNGTKIKVETPTHQAGTVDFHSGAIASLIMSFDTWEHHLPMMEIYGSEGSLVVPDPNSTTGTILYRRSHHTDWQEMPITHKPIPHRGAGVADMADAITQGQTHRANGELAAHVVDAMQALEESSDQERHIRLTSTCRQPAALAPESTTVRS